MGISESLWTAPPCLSWTQSCPTSLCMPVSTHEIQRIKPALPSLSSFWIPCGSVPTTPGAFMMAAWLLPPASSGQPLFSILSLSASSGLSPASLLSPSWASFLPGTTTLYPIPLHFLLTFILISYLIHTASLRSLLSSQPSQSSFSLNTSQVSLCIQSSVGT